MQRIAPFVDETRWRAGARRGRVRSHANYGVRSRRRPEKLAAFVIHYYESTLGRKRRETCTERALGAR